ncbi:nucleoside-diphosphate kinase [Candidatus Beckwithbacteria bacterium CG_4_9_14_0_2_um_filter_47_11]|uniref:Nucleoside diphosphate kinase n=1 Tax=Candidatus Beckwithbacteria bacterium CG_4_9_14_0_2_um_filter_47_11 TaxID=1974494 RepID=A0A2M8G3V2_9BACT|nr:MAG: nucleoside-diphosphate kinase [Candidatus Beckwithbacteria bacterium CG_4_9_14_0_2_um_filter_47_11]
MKSQQSVVLVKPDALQRGLLGEIIHRFERKGIKLIGLKMMRLTDEVLDQWYVHHKEKAFFAGLKKFMQSSPIVAMLWEGIDAIPVVRKIVGATSGREAEAGSIRGDFSMSRQLNLIHASDGEESAKKEKGLVFSDEEVVKWQSADECLFYSSEELGE